MKQQAGDVRRRPSIRDAESGRLEEAISVRLREEDGAAVVDVPENALLQELCGRHDNHLAAIEREFGVTIARRGGQLSIHGGERERGAAGRALEALAARAESGLPVRSPDVAAALRMSEWNASEGPFELVAGQDIRFRTATLTVEPRTPNQRRFMEALAHSDLTIGIGPAGTGKTYLAVAAAVTAFLSGQVERIVLSRPAVEAGERLGFLPGDIREKIDPYLMPLYDALDSMLTRRRVERHMERGRIEIAPLAFMRGRTLADAFVVLDEAQNCSITQMKMFLTRIGENARMAVTGDLTQVDLPKGQECGLAHARRVLADTPGIAFVDFGAGDVVRHSLARRIVESYARHSNRGPDGEKTG